MTRQHLTIRYDKIGNRLTETRGTVTYLSNGTGGNTPQLDQIYGAGSTAS